MTMSDTVSPPSDDPSYDRARAIVKILQDKGYQAVFAGGCVRDAVMGKPPKDYDIATDAHPEDIESIFPNTIAVGKAFGVMIVQKEQEEFEVATFRQDQEYTDGRRPEDVEFCSARKDVQRRDFTVNGLLWDPVDQSIYDYVNGREDIQKETIRTIGDPDERFSEDYLRMIRAPRFAAQLGFRIEGKTKSSIKNHAGNIQDMAEERIQEEMDRLLQTENPGRGVRLLEELNLLEHVLPDVYELVHLEEDHHRAFDHIPAALDAMVGYGGSIACGYSLLLHDVVRSECPEEDRTQCAPYSYRQQTGERVNTLLRELRVSNDRRQSVVWTVKTLPVIFHEDQLSLARKKRIVTNSSWTVLRDAAKSIIDINMSDCADRLQNLIDLKQHADKDELSPEPLLNGYDLMKMGMKEGPELGEVLRKIRTAQLNEEITTKCEARKRAEKYIQDVITNHEVSS